ncbi:MAG: hypothetical protein OXC01_21315 [Immundisolibacterales bacterium]|nr:hypothetical protein [Immundisolibacterales bacterium]
MDDTAQQGPPDASQAEHAGFALGAAFTGILANGLGFDLMTRAEEYRTAAFWLFAGFVPPAVVGNVIAWRFGRRIAAVALPSGAEEKIEPQGSS